VIQLVFSVLDDKACYFSSPFCAKNEQVAIRMFSDAAQDSRSEIGKHGSDFSLHALGTFDDSSGKMESFLVPKFLVRAISFINKEVENGHL